MARNKPPVQRLINSIKNLQQARGNTLLIGMPHEQAHVPMAVIQEEGWRQMPLNSGTLKNTMPLNSQVQTRAQTRNTYHMRSSAHLTWQGVGPNWKQNKWRMLLPPKGK